MTIDALIKLYGTHGISVVIRMLNHPAPEVKKIAREMALALEQALTNHTTTNRVVS